MRNRNAAIALPLIVSLACTWDGWPPNIRGRCLFQGLDPRLTRVYEEPTGCEHLGYVGAEHGRISMHWWWARDGDPACADALLSKEALALGADTVFFDGVQRTTYAEPKDPADWVGGSIEHSVAAAYRCRQ